MNFVWDNEMKFCIKKEMKIVFYWEKENMSDRRRKNVDHNSYQWNVNFPKWRQENMWAICIYIVLDIETNELSKLSFL